MAEAVPVAPRVMRTPRKIDVEVTSRCNLRCRYCYYFDNPALEYRDLPTDEWLRFLDECGRCAVMDLTLGGGEPFLRADLPTIIDGVVRNHMRFSMVSNGTLIDDSIAAFIGGTGRCDSVQVSLDGSRPETHDVCRGAGSFDRAVRGIRTLQRHGVPVTVRVTIHRQNVDDLENTAHFLLEELGLSGFGTNSAGYLGSCRQNAAEVLLSTRERQRAMETLLRLAERYPGRISAQAGPLAEGRMWGEMETARASGAPPLPNGGHLTACGCVWDKIAVRADGAYVPCTMLDHQVLGRINRDPLAEVWQHSPALDSLRQRSAISLREFAFCTGCPYVDYCTGNCPALAYALTGEIDQPSPDACLWRYLQDGGWLVAAEGVVRGGDR